MQDIVNELKTRSVPYDAGSEVFQDTVAQYEDGLITLNEAINKIVYGH